MLARCLVEIADSAIDKNAIREGAPMSVRFLTQIAFRVVAADPEVAEFRLSRGQQGTRVAAKSRHPHI